MKRFSLDQIPEAAHDIALMCQHYHTFSKRVLFFDSKTQEFCVLPLGGADERRVYGNKRRYLFGGVYDKGADEKALIDDLMTFKQELGY